MWNINEPKLIGNLRIPRSVSYKSEFDLKKKEKIHLETNHEKYKETLRGWRLKTWFHKSVIQTKRRFSSSL